MVEYGYIEKKNDLKVKKQSSKKKLKKIKIKKKSSKKLNSPPKINIKNNAKINDSSSNDRIKKSNSKIFVQINNIINENKNINDKNIKSSSKKNKNNIISKKIKKGIKKKKNRSYKISLVSTQGAIDSQYINSNFNDEKENYDKNKININLININLNNPKSFKIIAASNHALNVYTFEEAIKYDLHPLCKIFYIYLLTNQAIFHAFLFRSPLELFPLRLCLLFFIISSDIALNAIFYFDDKISKKYRYAKSLFIFAFSNNLTVILLSTFIGFILLTLFTKLSNSTNDIRNIFRNKEEKMKKDKKYIVTNKRKKEIQKEIELILKKFKIKTIILIVIELLLMLFFFYYVTIFCHVYSSTQISWIWDSFLSMLSRVIIDFLLSLLFAKLYRIAVESNFQFLYKLSLFFYSFG